MESAVKGKAKRRHLDAEECVELGMTPEGTEALTQPHAFDRSNSDPNRGLYPRSPAKYPRTPTKRKKLDGDTDKYQRGITQFFPVTGVVKVSPQKTAQPSSSSTADRLSRALPFTRGPTLREAAATPIKEEPVDEFSTPTKEELAEIFATPMEEEEEEEVVNYLEGMTEAMFGDDDEFECGTTAKASGEDLARVEEEGVEALARVEEEGVEDLARVEEEGVEALPDAHYGLLGTSTRLVQPQGHVEDLPEELLRLVFSLLSAQDLYRHVSLVCRRWRDIVTQALFVPWKKLYFRYQMREKEAVKEICLLLRRQNIVKETPLSVINMIKFMAEYKPTQRVKPEAVLHSVRKHHLFPQAEACLKHRIPDILGIEGGPNPWAAMALILVLCPNVGDVLDLVARLKTCLPSLSDISEYLSAMATVLLAMTNGKINISNRRYYNIYYVLHLMQNAPPRISSRQTGRAPVQVTQEQQQVLNHDIQAHHVVKIVAFAGTGKTTTLVHYTQQRPLLRFLYVAFNKSVATQARRCFPSNVDCKTVHSMAFGAVGIKYQVRKQLCPNLRPFSVAWWLPKGRGGFINAKVVTLTLSSYMASTDTHVTPEHVPWKFKNNQGQEQEIDHEAKMMYVRDAQNIWDKMVDLNGGNEKHHMTHDGYLKLWQLSQPCLDKYDVILIDEAQDCTPAIMDIMLPQRCGKVLVGDPHQQIYTFRGAVNALEHVQHTHLYYLTQSFRFGAEIAYVGASILQVCKHVSKVLVGGQQEGSVRGEASDVVSHVQSGVSEARGKTAILSRCNVTVFSEAVRLTDANPRCRLHIVGGVENFGLAQIMDIWLLMQPEQKRTKGISDGFIRSFSRSVSLGGYAGLKDYATKTQDRELETKLAVVEKYNNRIPELVNRIKACSEHDHQHADFILGTVHKSKGLEFDTVVVTDDFAKVPVARHNLQRIRFSAGDIPKDEWNLLYVAVTRAQRNLIITKNISNILTLAGEYFLRSELTSALTSDDRPVCLVRECQNRVMPDATIVMSKLPIKYMDSEDAGGPLCESCVWQRLGPSACLLAPPERLQALPQTQERLELPINYALLLALF
ncbi:F-box DNA helicase 1 isoform X2 [Hypomesus transpacificus]|uniref:F-box DNA helicase 1 isoform X2 n=1 Tax=Hypomesus transpacificus TaxID=137520 RepID=UPI001F08362D|nr:F-box DNA helicase 1 isoform X2 [Hypomesus transpacificus]